MNDFAIFLKNRLKRQLPGAKAQLKMAPQRIADGNPRKMEPFDCARCSSVLVLLFPNGEHKLELVLTLRTSDIDHGGQISFPGGRAEKQENHIETALREANEEIGIEPSQVSVADELSELFLNHSNNRVTPVVGFLPDRPEFKINPKEVQEVFTVELDALLDKKNINSELWDLKKDTTYRVPYWDMHRVPLWGATAMMLSELLDLYREFKEANGQN